MPDATTREDLISALRGVIDPELHANIVDLGMVRDVAIAEDGGVDVRIALTVASCPLRGQIESDVCNRIRMLPGVSDVRFHMDVLNQEEKARLMDRARRSARENADPTEVPPTTRAIAVSSGKGGVGKSTTTANVAVALADLGFTVGVLDADIWGFSVDRMLGVEGRLSGHDGKIEPIRVDGPGTVKVVSMGLLVDDEEQALMWRGLVLTRAVEQFLRDVRWGDLDYLVIDMPPGTGDIQMGLARMLPQAAMLLVTTPQKVAQKVAVRAGNMARRSHMPVLGVVENMSEFVCEHGAAYHLFGSGGGTALSAQLGVPLLASVPLDPLSMAAADGGTPVVRAHPESPAAVAYTDLASRIARDVLPPLVLTGCTARIEQIFDDLEAAPG
ncbi:MAG: Mrp/NBP35 family ATP-binding protein [Acidimicrobiia bacterium]|nr:Mrp/NBP35 family ATP-binding protein [Acidimicrobiia bacterium]